MSVNRDPAPHPQEAVITVWKDGSWRCWGMMDAHYAQNDPDWLLTLPVREIVQKAAQREK